MNKSIFINGFQKGQAENSQIGMGNLVGIDTYSKKGVARLSKKMTIVTTGFTSYPTFMDVYSGYIWVQCADGSVLYSSDGGSTWTDTSFVVPGNGASGNGLIIFQGYCFAFANDALYYHNADPTVGGWTSWKTGLQRLNATPINNPHFPFLFPNSRGFYFCNGNKVGFVGQVGTTTFNPAGVSGTDYFYNDSSLVLPSLTYVTTNLDFLPPNNLAIVAFPYQSASQNGDLITWDTVSSNKFSPPLHIYGNSIAGNASITGGIKQVFNRNQVLYIVSGGNHAVYETNGSSYNLIEDIALQSSMRSVGGGENDYPVFFNSFPSAICTLGNKLLTGVALPTNTSTYPASSTGIFPVGVWSITFDKDGVETTQCEYVLPYGNSAVSPQGTGNYAKITLVKPINMGSGTAQLLVGFAYKDGSIGEKFGVGLIDQYNYGDDYTYTAIESPFYEIGTALNPETINTIEINLVKNLLTGQRIRIEYRTSLSDSWSFVTGNGSTFTGIFTGDSTKNFYQITDNNIGKTRFIQLRIQVETNSDNAKSSPEIRSIKIS